MIIYQVLTRLFGKGRFSSFDEKALNYIKSLGASHVWYTGVIRHATGKDFVKGAPGSPYSISDYHDVNPYLADDQPSRMAEFQSLINRTHKAGLKVIIDFVPNHVACDYPEWQIPTYPWCDYDWTDTRKINYSHPDCFAAMLEIVRFWALKGVDGMRCDMIDLVPQQFFSYLIKSIKAEFPEFIFIGETYKPESYKSFIRECGFDLLYDKSGIYDKLRAMMTAGASARELTWNWQSLGALQPNMLNFLENHDEQRLASPWFAGKAELGYAALAAAALFNNASFMLYFGQEAGENAAEGAEGRTSIFNWSTPATVAAIYEYIQNGKGLGKAQRSILARYRSVLKLAARVEDWANYDLCWCNTESRGFNVDRHFAFARYKGDKCYVCVCNFGSEESSMELWLPADIPGGNRAVQMTVPANDYLLLG